MLVIKTQGSGIYNATFGFLQLGFLAPRPSSNTNNRTIHISRLLPLRTSYDGYRYLSKLHLTCRSTPVPYLAVYLGKGPLLMEILRTMQGRLSMGMEYDAVNGV